MPDLFRDVEKSVREKAVDLLVNPPAGASLTTPYNVYGEDEFVNDAFKPNFPFVWVLSVRVPPKQTRLPLILIERAPVVESAFEVGNRAGTFFTFNLHVFARNRGERGSFAAYLYQNLMTLPLYDFTVNPKTLRYTVAIDRRLSASISIGPDIGIEGALSNWETLTVEFLLKD